MNFVKIGIIRSRPKLGDLADLPTAVNHVAEKINKSLTPEQRNSDETLGNTKIIIGSTYWLKRNKKSLKLNKMGWTKE